MLLKNLIRDISKDKKKIIISGISTNSKKIKKNYIFFAIKGKKFNGEKFIKDAVYKGASVVVCSKSCKIRNSNILVIKTNKIRYLLSEISSKFYKSKPKNIIAVTGTNGKTSVSDIFYQILKINNFSVASIGTLGIKYNDKIIKTKLTSPDTITLHKNLNYLKNKRINNVIIEASSHGLDQKRLHHIKFRAAIFTNFSQDHLDYHKTMKSYLNAKLILFRKILSKQSTIISNKEIPTFKILKKIAKKKNLKISNINNTLTKIKNIDLKFNDDFKIRNLSMAIEAAKIAVKPPTYATTNKASGVNKGKILKVKYTPAATIVAACIRAETGVGPSIASGNHTCNGNCDDLPIAPRNRPTPANVSVVPAMAPFDTPSNISPKANDPIALYINIIPIKNPISPTLFVRKAFLLAFAAESFSNQCPIKRYELTPTNSQNIYMDQ